MKRILGLFLLCFAYCNIAHALPAGYTQLEYIQSTGTQYIDTGIKPTDNTETQMVAQYTELTGSLFAVFESNGNKYYGFGLASESQYRLWYGSGGAPWVVFGTTDTQKHTFSLRNKSIYFDDNVTPAAQSTLSVPSQTRNMYLFAANYGGNVSYPAKAKVYSVVIKDNGSVVRNMVPAKNSSGVIGMYDTVSDTFFTNAGSGTFAAGPVVLSPIPAGYTQLDYIETNGSQYIDTGITGAARWVGKAQSIQNTTKSQVVLGGNSSGKASSFVGSVSSGNMWTTKGAPYDTTYPITQAREFDLSFTTTGVQGEIGDVAINNTNSISFNMTWKICWHNSTYPFIGKLFYFKAYQNNSLVRDMVPVKSSGGVVGMYDRVTNTFFTNSGSGSFVAGPEIGIASTSYVAGMHEAINTTKQNKLTSTGANPNVIVTGDANGIVSSFTANNGVVTVTRSAVTLPWGAENSANRAEVWVD